MDRFFRKETFSNENEFVEFVNLYLITALSAFLYISHGIVFFLFANHPFLIITQALSVLVCIGAFAMNLMRRSRGALLMMMFLICASINIWTYMVDVGDDMRWYAILALCPLYFFSIIQNRLKVVLTLLIMSAFLSSTLITYYHEPVMRMVNAELYNTATSLVITISIALELILYKYVNTKRDNELTRIGTILDNIECGIVIVDAETHKILDMNPVAERMYDGSNDSIIGQNQEVHRSEQELVKANGETITIIKSVARILYNDRPALLESFTDISDLKEAEKKLRTLEITEQANQAKSDFLSRMSHEMRTPMNAIIGMAKIAEGTDDISRLKYCLSMIDLSSTHLLGLINDILDMSKIEAGKLELDNAPLNIERILMKVNGIMIEQATRKNIHLNISEGSGTDAQYMGDELRLTQVVTNLISNAVKFTPEGGTIGLSVSEVQNEDGYSTLRFVVSDTGIGLTKEQIDKLFNAFEQADGSISRKYGGTGLGLAISKSIIEKMGGRIWVESEPDKGSTFTFDVRLKRIDLQNREVTIGSSQAGSEPAADTKATPDFTGAVALLAEDVEINREIIITLLEGTNIEIDIAENGIEAVQKFKDDSGRYAVILMDIQMPGMNGYEATKAIRALDLAEAGNIPIIAMTADAFKEDIDKCLACGMNGHLKKPIEIEKVIETLSLYCDNGQRL